MRSWGDTGASYRSSARKNDARIRPWFDLKMDLPLNCEAIQRRRHGQEKQRHQREKSRQAR